MNTGMTCMHCGRPILVDVAYIGNCNYHLECARPPEQPFRYEPMPPHPGAQPLIPLTEDDVRRIVREELQRAQG